MPIATSNNVVFSISNKFMLLCFLINTKGCRRPMFLPAEQIKAFNIKNIRRSDKIMSNAHL